jgi:hypothetical protein
MPERNDVPPEYRLGSGPIEPEFIEKMNVLAQALNQYLNPIGKKVGFVLLTFNFDEGGRCNYISNADREDIKVLLREQLSYFEGMPDA